MLKLHDVVETLNVFISPYIKLPIQGINSIPDSFGKILCKKKLINKFADLLGGCYSAITPPEL